MAESNDVIIRPMRKEDEKAALEIIWRLIFYKTSMDILVDKITKPPIVLLCLFCGVCGFLSRYSVFQGVVLLLTPACLFYLFVRYIMLPMVYYKSPDFCQGLYKFWSRNDLGRHLWVAEVDGKVIGTAALNMLSPTSAQVFRVVVSKQYHGRGIASRLMNTIFEHCTKKNYEHIVLVTSYMQVPAIMLYEKLGFQRLNTKEDGLPVFLMYSVFLYHLGIKGKAPGIWAQDDSFSFMHD